jgi:hypothetical protein
VQKVICPDCGNELNEIDIEYNYTQTAKLDYENKLTVVLPNTVHDDGEIIYRCPYCESLNVDDQICALKFQLIEE